jgi:hypothetical protein
MKKIGLLCLALVLALGTLGVGYAMWSDEVTIEGTVDTGTLRLGIWHAVVERIEQEEGVPQQKDVATVDLSFKDPILEKYFQGFGNKWAYETLVVALNNTYPCLVVDVAFYLACVGSIPIHISAINISDPSGYLTWVWVEEPSPGSPGPHYGYFYRTGDPTKEEVINITIGGLQICQQMHWCDWDKADLIIHVKQPAEQHHDYNFVVEVTGEQWAE